MTDKSAQKEKLLYKARVAEQCERSEDLLDVMKEVVQLDLPLNNDERNLFSLAFKNVAGALRQSYRTIDSIEQKLAANPDSEGSGEASKKESTELFREKIQAETEDLCKDAVKLIDVHMLPHVGDDQEGVVFLLKMKADYYRYLAEVIAKLPHVHEIIEKCQDFYKQSYELAVKTLAPTNPMRLGVALNYSVFHYEIANDAAAAIQLAKSAFDEGIIELDGLESDGQKESVVILQLLRDNLTLWHGNHAFGGSGVFGDDENAADDDNLVTKIGDAEDEDGMVELVLTETVVETKIELMVVPSDKEEPPAAPATEAVQEPAIKQEPVATTADVKEKEKVKPSEPTAVQEPAASSTDDSKEDEVKPSEPAAVDKDEEMESSPPAGDKPSLPENMDEQ